MNIKLRKQYLGLGLLGWIAAIPAILIGLIAIGFIGTEINKAYWDSKVRERCEEDGGVTVYEAVSLTKEQYLKNDGKNGVIRIMPKRTSKTYHEFYWENMDTVINKSNPKVIRSEYITYRKSDEKKLGKWVTYSRRGGDFPTGFHPSSFGCVDMFGFKTNTAKEIFSIEME